MFLKAPLIVPDEVKRQNRLVVTTKTVWWNKSVAVFVHDFQVLSLVHQTLTQLGNVECRAAVAKNPGIAETVLVKVFGNWYRARVERLYGKYASLTLIDVGRFLEKVPLRRLLDINNMCQTVAYSPGAQVFFVDRFHPLRFQISDPEVLNRATVKECINTNVWVEERFDRETGQKIEIENFQDPQYPVIHALYNAAGEYFADRLEPLLDGIVVPERATVSLLAEVELRSSEEVSVVLRIDDSLFGCQLTRFPVEELARLECELTVLGEQSFLETLDAPQENELVAVLWNEKLVRGRLAEFGTSTAKVYLFDYGISVTRLNVNLLKLPTDIADRLPAFGLRVRIRNSVPEICDGNPLLVLSSIEFDRETGIVTADVFPIEPNVELRSRISEKEYSVDESKQLETSVDETQTHEDVANPSLETFPSESIVNHITIDSFSSSHQTEPENSTSDFDASTVEQTMSLSVQSYLSPPDDENCPDVGKNGVLELSNEFEPLSNLCDIPPEEGTTEAMTADENCEALDRGPLPQNDNVVEDVQPVFELKMNGEIERLEGAPEKPANGTENPAPDWRRDARRSRSECTSEKSWREPRRDANRNQSTPDRIRSTPKLNLSISPGGDGDPPRHQQGLRNDRRSMVSRTHGADSRSQDPSRSSHHRAMSHPRHRPPGSGRIPRDRSIDKFHYPENRNPRLAEIEVTPHSPCNPESEPHPTERSGLTHDNGVGRPAASYKESGPEKQTSAQSFSVECVLEEKEGVFLGADHVRRSSIERMLSELSVDSLQEIPLRRLKIDQLVLLEHMKGLVRGRVVEITRHKIELRLVDQYGACSASRVFLCPDAITDPETTLQEIQLKPPRKDLHYGDLVHVIRGHQNAGARLVVSRHEFRGKKEQNDTH